MKSNLALRGCLDQMRVIVVLLLSGILVLVSVDGFAAKSSVNAPLRNQLAGDPSAYLALHGKDPVAWQTWNEETLRRAQAENKLIFVSIGYFSCHWCHVMQRESYSDADVAAILNKHYIAIKVDRELFPALDARLIEFVERTRGSAGWPLNVILTPDAYPLLGMTYLPKQDFMQAMSEIQQQWQSNSTFLHKTAQAAALALDSELRASPQSKPTMPPGQLWQRASALYVQQALTQADTLLGGFGQQSKFPMVPHLNALLDVNDAKPSREVEDFLRLTLEQMASQNLRDSLGGGFFRYTVDPDWQTPHFEKMLYDNASLAELYLRAGQQLKRDDFIVIAYQTLDFLVAHMQLPDGGMISSFSAVDDKNIEGGYYLWQSNQVRRVLSDGQYAVINALWRLDSPSPFDAGYLPRVATPYDEVATRLNLPLNEVIDTSLAASKILAKQRAQRSLPRDQKRLAAWNGLALTALTQALLNLQAHGVKPSATRYRKYLQAAKGIRAYIHDKLVVNGELRRAVSEQGREMGQAALEDYVFVAAALLQWINIDNNAADAALAQDLIAKAWRHFFDDNGWRQSRKSLLALKLGVPAIADGALPSPSSTLLSITPQQTSGDVKNIGSALAMAENLLLSEPFNYPGLIRALSRMAKRNP